MNQMVLANLIPECYFTRNHTGKSAFGLLDTITSELEKFVANLLKNKLTFKRLMGSAMKDDIEVQSVEHMTALMQGIFKVPVHASEIAELAMKEAVKPYPGAKHFIVDRWGMYNAATWYASHAELTPNVQDQILYRAEDRLLDPKYPIKVPAI